LDKSGFRSKADFSTEGRAHSLSHYGPPLTISKHLSAGSRKSILTKVAEHGAGRLSAENFRQV